MAKKRGVAGSAFTVQTPLPLPAEREGEHWWFEQGGRSVRLSNLDKIYWPDEGFTKGDMLAYYYNVAERILPYLRDRPLTMKRMPDGVAGPHFYEKEAPPHTPAWMRRCPVEHEDTKDGIVNYLMADDAAGVLFVANLGAIEFHPLHSRCDGIERPDYVFFDLDPFPPATYADVLVVARHVKAALDALGLPSYPKTTGATGMHIYVGLLRGPGHDAARDFVETIGRAILRADPGRVTMEWQVSKRTGKVFIDHNMNRRGANIAGAYSLRPEPGAPVSMPVTWEEIEAGLDPRDFTIDTVHERLASSPDHFRGVLENRVDLRPALEALGLPADFDLLPDAPAERAPPEGERLREYRRKRDFDVTPEPPPSPAAGHGDLFVIQKHNATRLHYDLRLERDGVLASWAVPKGLPLVPGEKRLAVQTEDHPLEYGDFEGWIPKGEYGGGEVRIFDRGRFEALEWEPGKITFRLEGSRHRGEYHLVKTGTDWIVFLSRSSAGEQPPPPPELAPMLAESGGEAFDDPGWRFEPKLDGIRTLAYVATDGTTLVSRTGRDQTASYPELANLAQQVNALSAILDGEIVALEPSGVPSFERLQQRMNLSSPRDVERARKAIPVTLYAFDLLWLDGELLTGLPLEERRERLEAIATQDGPLRLSYFTDGAGLAFFEAAKNLRLEGAVAKRLGSPYLPGRRSRDWIKIKAVNRQDCVVLGWTPGTGSRSSRFGSLLVGAYVGDRLAWIGHAGTGFTEATLDMVLSRLRELETDRPPIDDRDLAREKGARWVRPELVCEVEYLNMTAAGKLRAPSFKGLRPDKLPEDCRLEPPAA